MNYYVLPCFFLFVHASFQSKQTFQLIFPGVTSSYAELVGTISHELSHFSLCHWSKTNRVVTEWETIFYYYAPLSSKPSVIWSLVQHSQNVQFLHGEYVPQILSYSNDESEWIHFCFTWSAPLNTIKIFANGHLLVNHTKSRRGYPIEPNGIVRLGLYGEDKLPLKGHVSEVHLWDYILTSTDVTKIYNCQDQFEGNVISWFNSRWKLHNATIISAVSLPCHRRD